MHEYEEIQSKIIDFISKLSPKFRHNRAQISQNMVLEDFGLDIYDAFVLSVYLEEFFEIYISENEVWKILSQANLRQICDFCNKKLLQKK